MVGGNDGTTVVLDLKGVLYSGTICEMATTAMVVHLDPVKGVAKIDTVLNDVVQLREEHNMFTGEGGGGGGGHGGSLFGDDDEEDDRAYAVGDGPPEEGVLGKGKGKGKVKSALGPWGNKSGTKGKAVKGVKKTSSAKKKAVKKK